MNEYKDFLNRTLNEVAKIAMVNFGKVSSTVKSDDNNQVLTEADIEIGRIIVERIKSKFPGHNIIDEEAGVIDNESDFTWVVDPIDGTSNFASGLPHFGIMIGLLNESTPVAGGIVLPAFEETYIALRGEGTTLNGKLITVTNETSLLNSLVSYGIDGHQENQSLTKEETIVLSDIILGIRNLRSSNSVFDQIQVAKGTYGGSMNRTCKIWDNVAQQIVIEEAGGIYTDFHGSQIDYSNPISKANDNFTFCTAAPVLHNQLQRIITGSY